MSVSTLNVQTFVTRENLSFSDLDKLKKCDLIAIAKYFNLELAQGMRKAEIIDIVASHMKLKDETQNSDQAQISNQTDIELAKLKLEMERERMRLEFEERERQKQR